MQQGWISGLMRARPRVMAAVLGVGLAGCATGASLSAGNALPGIALNAAGPSVLLSWDPEGPLGRQMTARTPVQVVASYPSARGPVTGEPVARATVDGSFAGLKFDLPDRLQQAPTGPVCLRLALRGRAIPVRIPDAGQTSDGFVYSEWESHAALGAQREALEQRRRVAETNLARVSTPGNEFEEWRQARGLSSEAQCETLTAQIDTSRPRTALTGAAKEAAARDHCVALFNAFPTSSNGFGDRPGLTGLQLATEVRSALPAGHALRGTADGLLADIRRFGDGQTYLSARALAVDSSTKTSIAVADGRVNAVVATSLLESYTACVSEAEGRFDLSYKSWQETSSTLTQSARNEPLRQECRARFRTEEQRLTQLQQVQEENLAVEAEIEALAARQPEALPAQKSLIPAACPAQLRPA